MPRLKAAELLELVETILMAHGASTESARCVGEILVRADQSGHPSHGVLRILQYTNEIHAGSLKPQTSPRTIQETAVTALVDGGYGFGQVVATCALQIAIEKARQHGLSAVGTTRSYHVGRLGEYAERAARSGFVALLWANGMVPGGRVIPFGGNRGVLGTNPVAAGVPRDEGGPPIVVDFATAAIAEGKIRVARARGESIPPGMATDSDGKECTDPERFYDGGFLRCFGGHKGYGISVMCEVLAGLVTGSGTPCMSGYQASNSTMFVLLDPACFRPMEEFLSDVQQFCEVVKSVPTAEGFDEVMLPGEPEHRCAAGNVDHVEIADSTWQALRQINEEA